MMSGEFPEGSPEFYAGFDNQETPSSVVDRESPDPSEERKNNVARWVDDVHSAKKHWAPDFKRMRYSQEFAYGVQWDNATTYDEPDRNYTANIVLRHVQQRVAALYAKNPKAVARTRPRLEMQLWDGKQESLLRAQKIVQQAMVPPPPIAPISPGMVPPPSPQITPEAENAAKILEEHKQISARKELYNKMARTLELLYQYNIDEQVHSFKSMMKFTVRRAVTTGVGYVKLGFERAMKQSPELSGQIAGIAEQLGHARRLAADIEDNELDATSPEVDELKSALETLQQTQDVIVREGLRFDYPASTSIIPDKKTKRLRGFLGADWVAQEYYLSPASIQEIYGVDIGSDFTAFTPESPSTVDEAVAEVQAVQDGTPPAFSEKAGMALVFEIWYRKTGQVMVVCDGYPDYLKAPAEPDVYTERFWPVYALTPNECDHETRLFPPSDVSLVLDMQRELNRSRQSLREHRYANRPKTAVAAAVLNDNDRAKLRDHPANAVLELQGLQPGQKIEDLLQRIKGPPIDSALYDTRPAFEDFMHTIGHQEANLGGTGGATATESSIAETSRMSAVSSNIDDLDDLLTDIARNAGQILLLEVSPQIVKEQVGAGAVWPEMSRKEAAEEIYLQVEAGSTGRPNQAQEIRNAEKLVPLLIQIPGISPEFVATVLLRRLDDRMEITDAFQELAPSIVSQNNAQQPTSGAPGKDPRAQGGQGAQNAPQAPGNDSAGGLPAPAPFDRSAG